MLRNILFLKYSVSKHFKQCIELSLYLLYANSEHIKNAKGIF